VPLLLVVFQPDFGATIIMLVIVAAIVLAWMVKYKAGRTLALWLVSSLVIVGICSVLSLWLLVLLVIPLALTFRESWKIGIVSLALLLGIGSIGGTFMYMWQNEVSVLSKDSYVRMRLDSFVGASEMTPQIRQSRIAIGSGGFWGKGIAQGTQTRLRFLPEYTTDFIFATYVEERGFAGILLLFAIYITFFARLVYLALQVRDEYARLVIIGLIVKLWFETFVNIGMNMGVLPTKGVALPFVSYGGSSLLANSLILGIILSLYRYESKHDTMSPSYGLA
jgi:rod shape determining protein RodA